MAASSSDEARARLHAASLRLLRKLGPSDGDEWAGVEISPNGRAQLVVVERVLRASHSDSDIGEWMRDARRLATLEHANVARIRDVVTRAEDVLVISDFVDGVRWSELARSEKPPSLELSLRVLSDVLSGLSAIHNLRDEKRQPLGLVHGALTPESIVVGLDGVARIVSAHRMRTLVGGAGSRTNCYLAPELLLADDSADPRADIYGVGVMLWEALSGRLLFDDTVAASSIVTQVLGGKVPRAVIPPEAGWAAPFADLVARALRGEPARRLGSAASFGAELRRIAGAKLAPTVRVAGFLRATYGDSVRSRRAILEERAESAVDAPDAAPDAGAGRDKAPVEVEIDVEDNAPPTVPRPAAIPPVPRQPDRPALPPPRSPPTTMRGVAPPAASTGPAPTAAPAPAAARAPLPPPVPATPVRAVPVVAQPPPISAPALEGPPTPEPPPATLPESVDLELVSVPPPPRLPAQSVSSIAPTLRKPQAARNRVAAVLIFGCAVVVGAAIVWSFAASAPKHSSTLPTVVAPEVPPAASQPSAVLPELHELPAASANPTPSSEGQSAPAAAAAPPAAAAESAPAASEERPAAPSVVATAPTPPAAGESAGASRPAQAAPTRLPSKRKYEPEGI